MRGVAELLAAGNVVLGPMAGIAEAPFRGICKRMGAGLTYTELVSTIGLHHNPDSRVARSILTLSPLETPCVVQVFGADVRVMAEQSAGIVERLGDDVAMIDINMACPVAKVVSKGQGAALMRTPELAARMVAATVAGCDVPVSVKLRKGWSDEEVNAIEFARLMEASGAAALAIHGRTRAQLYEGSADWETIAAVKEAVGIPVLGSGDVFSADDARAMLDQTGVDAVMVARGARGNPWIFAEARALIDHGERLEPPTAVERVDVAREHFTALVEFAGDRALRRMRKHLSWYTAGLPRATTVREGANRARTVEEMYLLLDQYREYLAQREARANLAGSDGGNRLA